MKNRVTKTCTNIHANGGCNQCDRAGFAFLPVRYAVAKHPLAKQIALSEARIKTFTDIFLNKLVDEQGVTSNKNNDAWYILRKLRSGYLYVYDEHPLHPHWLCYAVGENGELTQFPAGQLVLPEKVTCNDNLNYALAGLVALQDKKIDRTINIIFLEAPYNYKRLKWISHNPEWRLKHMQQVTLSQIASSPFYFSEEEIQKHVAEYSKASPVELLKNDLEPGRFANIAGFSAYASNDRDTYPSLLQAFNKAIGIPNKGCAVAVFDTVGIIRQLDSYRMSALQDFANSLQHGDGGSEKEIRQSYIKRNNLNQKPYYSLNERNYKWYLSVDKLKELMAASLDVNNKGYGELLPPGIPENFNIDDDNIKEIFKGTDYRHVYDYYNNIDERAKLKADEIIEKNNITSASERANVYSNTKRIGEEIKMWVRNFIARYQRDWMIEKNKSKDNISKSEKEILNDYIEWDDWNNIKKMFDNKYNESKLISISFDSDYVIWINKKLHDDLDKYDQECPIQCGAVVKIIADILKDGILSGASKSLWRHIILDNRSFIDRGLSLNNTVLYDDIKETIANFSKKDNKKKFITPSKELNKELIGKIEKNAAKIRDFISKVADHDGKEIFKIKTAPLVSTFNSLKTLHNTAINTTSSLVIDELKNGISKELIKQNTLAIGFRYSNRLVEIHNFGNTINKSFYGPGFKSYVAEGVQMTVSQANDYLNSVNKYLGKDTADVRGKSVKLYDNGEKVGGNYQFDEKENGKKVTVFIFSREDNVANMINVINTRGVDALNSDIKTMYENQQKTLGKVNVPSAVIIKLGCVYSLISAIKDYSDKKDFSSLWKLISSTIVVIQNSSEFASWTLTKKAEKLLSKSVLADTKQISDEILERAAVTIVDSEKLIIFSKAAGHIVSLMAVYDAVKGILEAIDIYNSGGLSEDYRNKYISTGVSFISSVVIGLFVSNIFLGAVAAVASIAILFFFDNNRIVPECIQNWLRRSKFGRQGDVAPGRPFADMDTEQGSLSMLFKGVTFTAAINSERFTRDKTYEEKTLIEKLTESQMAADGAGSVPGTEYHTQTISKEIKHINISISFPEKFSGTAVMKEKNIYTNIVYYYLFDSKGRVCEIVIDNNIGDELLSREKMELDIVDNDRIKIYTNSLEITDGMGNKYIVKKDNVIDIKNLFGGYNGGYVTVTENKVIELEENFPDKKLSFDFSLQSDGEILRQEYILAITLGSDRKN